MSTPAERDAAARALLSRGRRVPEAGSLAHLMPEDERGAERAERARLAEAERIERARVAAERRAERRAATLLPDLEQELIGQLDAVPTGYVPERAVRAFVAWATAHTDTTEEERRQSIEAAAALNPTCEVEWQLALACAGAPVADGFDLSAHVKAVAAVVRRVRRLS